mgnify:CR=1 FL=1
MMISDNCGLNLLHPIAGFSLGTTCAAIKTPGRRDLVIMKLAKGSKVAALFTQNAFCAAPVLVAKRALQRGCSRYLVVNTGNANAGTGERGVQHAELTCQEIAKLTGVDVSDVMPFSTGVIGEYLPIDRLLKAIPGALSHLDEDGWSEAANGIMTTDTRPKGASVKLTIPTSTKTDDIDGPTRAVNGTLTLTGIAKGSGMIKPDMATMLSFIATDATVDAELLHRALRLAAEKSFNRITVDGDTSTNDALVFAATGCGDVIIDEGNFELFATHLEALCTELAQACVRDGEGATKFVSIVTTGAASQLEAKATAYTVAESPLVKTALGASDPNWGRILAAVGRAPIPNLDISKVSVSLNGTAIVEGGARALGYTEQAGQAAMQPTDIHIVIDLGRGESSETVWTTDLGHEYVRINAEYRT